MPDHLLEFFAAFALRCAVLDDVAEIVRLRSGIVEIEIEGRSRCRLSIKPRDQRVEIIVDRTELVAGSFLQSANGDVARRVAIELNAGAALAVKSKFTMQLAAM